MNDALRNLHKWTVTRFTLKRHRRTLGLTQAGLAAQLGVPQPLVCQWESGSRPIPHERAIVAEWWAHRSVKHTWPCERCEQIIYTAAFLGVDVMTKL